MPLPAELLTCFGVEMVGKKGRMLEVLPKNSPVLRKSMCMHLRMLEFVALLNIRESNG